MNSAFKGFLVSLLCGLAGLLTVAFLWFLGWQSYVQWNAANNQTDAGAKLQAIASIGGSLIGAVLSGAIAALVAIEILRREERARASETRNSEMRAAQKEKDEFVAFLDWSDAAVSICIEAINAISHAAFFDDSGLKRALLTTKSFREKLTLPAAISDAVGQQRPSLVAPLADLKRPIEIAMGVVEEGFIEIKAFGKTQVGVDFDVPKFIRFAGAIDEFGNLLAYLPIDYLELIARRNEIISGLRTAIDASVERIEKAGHKVNATYKNSRRN